jgi:hypothetical protein
LRAGVTVVSTRLWLVSPDIGTPLKRHWWRSGSLPVTPTLNRTVSPADATQFWGGVTMAGGTTGGSRVITATWLVTAPPKLLMTTS